MTGRLLPEVNDVTAPFWEATRDRTLAVQRCTACGVFQHYPRPLCLSCRGVDLDFVPVSGDATVYSFSVVHRAPDPDVFDPPYVVALVRLAEGPVMFTSIVGADPDDIYCDQPVTLDWRPLDDGRHLPVFRPTKGND